MKYVDWAALGALAVIAYFGSDVSAFADCTPTPGGGCPPQGVPAPLIGVGPLASGAVALLGGAFALLRRKFR